MTFVEPKIINWSGLVGKTLLIQEITEEKELTLVYAIDIADNTVCVLQETKLDK